MHWIKLTKVGGEIIYVNLAQVLFIEPTERHNKPESKLTTVATIDGSSQTFDVEEAPSTIYEMAQSAQRSN